LKQVQVNELMPGDILGQPLFSPASAALLLKEGTVLTRERINYLLAQGLDYQPAFILEEATNALTTEEEKVLQDHFRLDVIKAVDNLDVQRTMVHSYQALSDIQNQVKEDKNVTLSMVEESSRQLVKEVLVNNDIMLQLAALKSINEYTFGHSINVAIYAAHFAKMLGAPKQVMEKLALAGLLHDIGKMAVPTEILDKPDKLTRKEFEAVKWHAYESYQRLATNKNIEDDVIKAVFQHHERLDGTGYLQGLKGKEIHPWAKVLAITDVYDALTSRRCYRDAVLPHDTAEHLMALCSQGSLDRNLLISFLQNTPLFPLGAKVSLSTGETGTVVGHPQKLPLRPAVEVEEKQLSATGNTGSALESAPRAKKRIDLDECPTILITGVEPPSV